MSRLTRDGTAEPVSRDQILRHARGQGNIIFPVQLTTSRIGNLTRLIHTLLYVMTIHTYIHTTMNTPRLAFLTFGVLYGTVVFLTYDVLVATPLYCCAANPPRRVNIDTIPVSKHKAGLTFDGSGLHS